jgi:predicted nucleic acid-binding protein
MFAARLLQRADVRLEPMRPPLEPATRMAISLDHPAYDCVYLVLAELLSCPMVTADRELCHRTLASGAGPKALHLDTIAK